MTDSLLRVENLSIAFRKNGDWQNVIHGVSFSVKPGEVLGIVGESGSGKTVSSLACMGLLPERTARVTSGKAVFGTHDLLADHFAKAKDVRGRRITMIFQEPMSSLNPSMRCGDQVLEAVETAGKHSGTAARERVVQLFREVELPDPKHIGKRYPHELSGGQKQRVMIAIAMAPEPELIIADEPTTALDVTVQHNILALLRRLQKEKQLSMIFISHDLDLVARLADRVAVMWKGEVVEEGDAALVLKKPQHPYTRGLLACKPAPGAERKRLTTVQDVLNNRTVTAEAFKSEVGEHPLLEVVDLKKHFVTRRNLLGRATAHFEAVKGVSFALYPGETLGLVGESGCGKSTVSRIIMELIAPTSGELKWHVNGGERRAVQLVFQDPYASLNPRKSAGSCLVEALQVSGGVSSRKSAIEEARQLLLDVGLGEDAFEKYPHSFSGGQRQRLVIARALCTRPQVLLLDESVAAIDVSVQAQVLNLLNELKKRHNLTFIFVSHDLSVVRYMCDRILVMRAGQLVEAGTADAVFNHPKEDYTRTLIAATAATF